jgi:hypothetical protein
MRLLLEIVPRDTGACATKSPETESGIRMTCHL